MQHDFILLDRSGSMKSLWDEAVSSINGYVKKLADDKVPTLVTLGVFDQGNDGWLDFTLVREHVEPKEWIDVKPTETPPRGMTPLNDAIGRIVNIAKDQKPTKCAMIIMTDGHENSSRELNVGQAKELLEECRKEGWQVIFLGANFDNVTQAASYNNAAGATFTATADNLWRATASVAAKRGVYGATGQSIIYTDEEKKAFVGPGEGTSI